jgi:hypothetical protein
VENSSWVSIVVRPLLLMFWLVVGWGTFYGAAFLYAVLGLGPRRAIDQALSGQDVIGGMLNLWLAALAFCVWTIVAVVIGRARRSRQ